MVGQGAGRRWGRESHRGVVRAGQHPGGSGDRLTAKMGISASRWGVGQALGPGAPLRRAGAGSRGRGSADHAAGRRRHRSGMAALGHVGDGRGLSPPAQQDMRDSGLSHLTAVSGANCAVLLLLVHWLCGWLRVARPADDLRCGGAGRLRDHGRYAAQCDAGRGDGRSGDACRAHGRASGCGPRAADECRVVVAARPVFAYSVGFMLSIAATGGLIALLERECWLPLSQRRSRRSRSCWRSADRWARGRWPRIAGDADGRDHPDRRPRIALLEWVAGLGEPIAGWGRAMCLLVLRIAGWQVLPESDLAARLAGELDWRQWLL